VSDVRLHGRWDERTLERSTLSCKRGLPVPREMGRRAPNEPTSWQPSDRRADNAIT